MEKYSVKIIHEKSDPTTWIINVYRQGFLFKKKIMTKWFTSEESAKVYMRQLKYKYDLK
ncbi:MAG: hypothetical protein AB1600_09810 [Bacteroidota bacterium]